jgi:hypothetical protein
VKEGADVKFLGFEGGTIKDGMMGKAYEWLVANEAELRSEAPEGTQYLGVYAPIFTSAKNPGDVYFVYGVDSYGALDRQAASGDSRFGELFDEWNGFLDSAPGTLGEKVLYKSLTAATVWGDE